MNNGYENQPDDDDDTQTKELANGASAGAFERLGDIIMQIWRELQEASADGNKTFRTCVCGWIESVKKSVDEYQVNVTDVHVCQREEQIATPRKAVIEMRSQLNRLNAILTRFSNNSEREGL
ncbi:hypothetical protein GOP47_0014251 [Adiantum capillus-veneris]|uniref:Uncharacterized protein n=1 Tax=Adiantum capillus-veneris TaxID=13818 RepID=A0A9D4ZBY2_ADICA|nr:hypothetical protein GOP47_0014251 [Adiantum capillus-veneris]